MTARKTSRGGRAIGAAQLLLGTATLARPARTTELLTRGRGPQPDVRIVRVLGARQAVQGAITVVRPGAGVVGAGAAVDALHAASLVPLLVTGSRHKRAALASAVLAAVAAGAGVVNVRRG